MQDFRIDIILTSKVVLPVAFFSVPIPGCFHQHVDCKEVDQLDDIQNVHYCGQLGL